MVKGAVCGFANQEAVKLRLVKMQRSSERLSFEAAISYELRYKFSCGFFSVSVEKKPQLTVASGE